ncbi:MAG TPA: hypothetical protein VHN15_01775, partial [Thermoanaerobaculia bacterium]|nr:hypothetical protein [Thermoanaerobaculia bacterium]
EIKAQLRNTSGATVYRSWIWPEMFARLERWDETLREWRAGDIGVLCGTVEDPFEPLPFPPEATLSVDVYYDDSFFESDGKLLFLAEGPRGEAYPAAGKYRLALLYARQPWAVDKNPRLIFLTASPAFRLNPPVLRRQTPAG